MKKKWLWMLLCCLLVVIVVYISWQKFGNIKASADILSKQEAQKLVQDRYQGTVKQIKLVGGHYLIELEKDDYLYTIKLDTLSGKVLSVTKTEATKSPPLNQPPVKTLSEDELKKIILAVVKGTINTFEKIGSNEKTIYKAVVKVDNTQTTLTVDAVTGKILSSTTTTNTEPSKSLTEAEVKEIAKEQVIGDVDHIWMETKGETTYYLVEIKTQDGSEAIVQIHAITRNVMSVTWDNHGKDDYDKKDDDD
ncbi:MAG: PepSY domain-containing protein [Bacillus sp. (in: Bacteria)]|nr:PepSY domain-containing protein [Bacillus sp. (in: firmicutes)]